MKKIIFLSLIGLLSASFHAVAQEGGKPLSVKFLVDAGIEYGGDELLNVIFTTGDDQSVKAGQGGFLAVGADFQFANIDFLMLRTSLGIKYNTTAAENANIYLTRLPFNLIPYIKLKNDIRIGIGITKHLNVGLKGDGFFPDVDFTSNIGPRFELGYKWAAITYTSINYKFGNNVSYAANSLGASISFTFPNK